MFDWLQQCNNTHKLGCLELVEFLILTNRKLLIFQLLTKYFQLHVHIYYDMYLTTVSVLNKKFKILKYVN